MDTLWATELRNTFANELEAMVAIFDLMGEASFAALAMTVASPRQSIPAPASMMDGSREGDCVTVH